MGDDEEGTLAALKAIRRELTDAKIAEHRGRIVKAMGVPVHVSPTTRTQKVPHHSAR
jgi:hypothetical protein